LPKPNTKWVTDVTEFSLFGQKLYLSPILDLFNGEIISYNLSAHSTFPQIIDMLDKAFVKIPDNTGLDNAVMENFFGILKSELLYLQKFVSVEHFIGELHEYIDYYNNHRIKAKLEGLSPVEYRTQSLQAVLLILSNLLGSVQVSG
jgi:transposase InsO family protein